VVKKLVKWAHQAIEMTCNQSVLPNVIIVLNKADASPGEGDSWDADALKEELKSTVQKSLEKNTYLKEKVEFWKEKNVQIKDVEGLLSCYYASFHAIRIPRLQSPVLIEQQITRLYDIISKTCENSQRLRQQQRMQLDAVNLHLYIRNALSHFATNPNTPFDFVKASFDINPISPGLNLCSGITRLAIIVQKCSDESGLAVWERISPAIASCILLSANQRNGTAPSEY